MKTKDVAEGLRVRWRRECGTIVWQQPGDARDARDVRRDLYGAMSADFHARREADADAGRTPAGEYELTTPDRVFSIDLTRPRVLVRLDRDCDRGLVQAPREDYRYVWITPRTLQIAVLSEK